QLSQASDSSCSKFFCYFCNKKLVNRDTLRRHLQRYHADIKTGSGIAGPQSTNILSCALMTVTQTNVTDRDCSGFSVSNTGSPTTSQHSDTCTQQLTGCVTSGDRMTSSVHKIVTSSVDDVIVDCKSTDRRFSCSQCKMLFKSRSTL